MKLRHLAITTLIAASIFLPSPLLAWCLIRDTDATSIGCGSATLFTHNCCTGNPRKWIDGFMEYRISNTTSVSLVPLLHTGINRWNSLEMSSFQFIYGGETDKTIVSADGVNIINIDQDFDANYGLGGQGILAISTTWTQGEDTTAYSAVESDIVFNDGVEFTWGNGTGVTIDTVAVMAHEAGHSAGLSHPGSVCRNSGSEGCGAEFPAATMFWSYSNGQSSLELDDAAALISAYPTSTFRVKVVNETGDGMPGVTVDLLDAAAPLDGANRIEGGRVFGDVTNSTVLMGNKTGSLSYINQTPFNLTDNSGHTNFIHPTHRTVQIQASVVGVTRTVSHTVANNTSTLAIPLQDKLGPVVLSVSPANGATNAPTYGAIRAEFNETMNAATLTPLTFTNSQGLSGTVSYDPASHIASFTPTSPLLNLTTYTFTPTTGVQDAAGNALASPVSWSFSTQGASSSSSDGCFVETVMNR